MALFPVKAEMKGTTSRWCRRIEAKISARKQRRRDDKKAVREARRSLVENANSV